MIHNIKFFQTLITPPCFVTELNLLESPTVLAQPLHMKLR